MALDAYNYIIDVIQEFNEDIVDKKAKVFHEMARIKFMSIHSSFINKRSILVDSVQLYEEMMKLSAENGLNSYFDRSIDAAESFSRLFHVSKDVNLTLFFSKLFFQKESLIRINSLLREIYIEKTGKFVNKDVLIFDPANFALILDDLVRYLAAGNNRIHFYIPDYKDEDEKKAVADMITYQYLKNPEFESAVIYFEENNILKKLPHKHFDFIYTAPDKNISGYLEVLIELLSSDGYLSAMVPASFCSSANDGTIRDKIAKSMTITEIDCIARDVSKNYIVWMKNEKDTVYNVKLKLFEETKKNTLSEREDKSGDISSDYLINNHSWAVEIYRENENISYLKYRNFDNKLKLGDLFEVFNGKLISSERIKEASDSGIYIMTSGDIDINGIIDYDNLKSADNISSDDIEKYLLEDGDIIITTRGGTFKAALFESRNKNIILSGGLMVLRSRSSNNKILPEFMACFLRSSMGKMIIDTIQRGSKVLNINSKDIQNVEIPVFDSEFQKEAVLKIKSAAEALRTAVINLDKEKAVFDKKLNDIL